MVKIICFEDEGAKVWYRNGDNYYALRKQLRPNDGDKIYRCAVNEHIIIKPRATTRENWRDRKVAHNIYIVRAGKERIEERERPERLFQKKLEQKIEKFTIQKVEKKASVFN